MREYISRLIRAGVPRSVAISACRQIKRDKGELALIKYVEDVEGENV